MLQLFRTIDDKLLEVNDYADGTWVNMVCPTEEEILSVCDCLRVDQDIIKAALDEEERPRLESEDGITLVLVDVPIVEAESNKSFIYTTIPMGIIVCDKIIITVCLKESQLVRDFTENRIKQFFTYKRTRFILQLLYKNAIYYLQYLKQIDKISHKIENDLHKSTKNKELIMLLKLEKSLVYFSTSLKSNEVVLEKLLRFEYIKKYPEDVDLLEDVIIENKQAIEMASIYSSILSGTMDAFASVISNNLNIVMKFLATMTIVMAIPTIIFSLFGMNVNMPFNQNDPNVFYWIIGGTLGVSGLTAYILYKKKMF
jgi:magnesium transporter